jgi:hypothetical protein
MEKAWTIARIEIQNCIKNYNLEIFPVNINKWNEIEHKIINNFTGLNDGFTKRWENKILNKFIHCAEIIPDVNKILNIILKTINKEEIVWVFIEDTSEEMLRYGTKYWGYEGKINDIIKLFNEIVICDFYIVSKKIKWVIGQNCHDTLFGYGEIVELLELKIKENNRIRGHFV